MRIRTGSCVCAVLSAFAALTLMAACSGRTESVTELLDQISNHEMETAKAVGAIHHSPSREDWKRYFQAQTETAKKHLEAARAAHAKLDARVSESDRAQLDPGHAARLERNAKAYAHIKNLETELAKPDASIETAKAHARDVENDLGGGVKSAEADRR